MVPWRWDMNRLRAATNAVLLDPTGQIPFQFTNEVPNALHPGFVYQSLKNGQDYYEVGMFQTYQHLGLYDSSGSPLITKVWGYGESAAKATFPGKTFIAKRNKTVEVKWMNQLKDHTGNPLPHLLPVDKSLHWAYSHMGYENYSIEANGVPVVPHLHGGHTESDSDGNPEYWFAPDWNVTGPRWVKQVLRYHNDQEAGTLWYHDHALGITRLNVYAGLAGFYILRDGQDNGKTNNPLNLPAYPYEAALVIQDRMFDQNGQLFYPSFPGDPFWDDFIDDGAGGGAVVENGGDPNMVPQPSALAEFFGDHILVNGMAWPKMTVEPRHYRLRYLNGSDSRFYVLRLVDEADPTETPIPFYQIGCDDGLMAKPVALTELVLAPGERADLVVDFTNRFGTSLVLRNFGPDSPFGSIPVAPGDAADPDSTGKIMRFEVISPFDAAVKDAFNPNQNLRPGGKAFAIKDPAVRTRRLALFEGQDEYHRLQPLLGVIDPNLPVQDGTLPLHQATDGAQGWFQDISENPMLGDTEIWEIYNATGDAHPLHVHLVSFEVLNRQALGVEGLDWGVTMRPQPQHHSIPGDLTTYGQAFTMWLGATPFGTNPVMPPAPNETGPKDTVHVFPGEVTRIKMTFDKPGRYVWHCHILSHEDHEMMRPMHVGPIPPPPVAARRAAPGPDISMAAAPNPFHGTTKLSFRLAEEAQVRLEILNLQGARVVTLHEGYLPAGEQLFKWSGTNRSGGTLAAGLYIAQLIVNGEAVARQRLSFLR